MTGFNEGDGDSSDGNWPVKADHRSYPPTVRLTLWNIKLGPVFYCKAKGISITNRELSAHHVGNCATFDESGEGVAEGKSAALGSSFFFSCLSGRVQCVQSCTVIFQCQNHRIGGCGMNKYYENGWQSIDRL